MKVRSCISTLTALLIDVIPTFTLHCVSEKRHPFLLLARYVPNVAKEEYMRSV